MLRSEARTPGIPMFFRRLLFGSALLFGACSPAASLDVEDPSALPTATATATVAEAPSSTPTTDEDDAPAPRGSVYGEWVETWGAPGEETDVTYHDEYRVSNVGGEVQVAIENRDQEIEKADVNGNVLTFTQHTSFALHYRLTLQANGNVMKGTVRTPEKTVSITWNRKRGSARRPDRD